MIKKDSLVALVLVLLIPLLMGVGGAASNWINPELAAGHANYARNFHLLSMLKNSIFFASLAGVVLLWIVACVLILRSKNRSPYWLLLVPFGPFGFAALSMLNERTASDPDRYTVFVRKMNWWVRVGYELCTFVAIWELAYEAMVLKRTLMIWFESVRMGVSAAQIMDIQNASSGMWAFGEGMEVMFLVVVFYVLRPIVFCVVANLFAKKPSREAA
ncbi:MAG TPA: hypothetical protein VK716_13610 [Terracidiphilus sp.]|jgi:hypothetical protein|nr:hypothetical protein [Terracidiphilus sp.]